MPQRRLLVIGPVVQLAIVTVVCLTALAFYQMGDRAMSGTLIGTLVARVLSLLPVARGRPYDVLPKVVTRSEPPPKPRED